MQKTQPASPGGKGKVALIIVLFTLLAVAGGSVAWFLFLASPQHPSVVKWKISRYLKEQTGRKQFSVDFKFPSAKEMAIGPATNAAASNAVSNTGPVTKKDFKTLRNEVDALQKELDALRREVRDVQRDLTQKKNQMASLGKELTAAQAQSNEVQTATVQSNLVTLKAAIAAVETSLPARQKLIAAKDQELAPKLSDLQTMQKAFAAQRDATLAAGTAQKTNELANSLVQLTAATRKKLSEATTYRTMYEVVGQQLWVADRLFESLNPEHRRVAMTLVRQAANDSLNVAENAWLACRIFEGYVWPNLDLATDTNWKMPFSLENIVNESIAMFRSSDETNNVLRSYDLLLHQVGDTPRGDWARVQVAQMHEQQGNYSAALQSLRAIKATNNFNGALRRIPWLEQQLKPKK